MAIDFVFSMLIRNPTQIALPHRLVCVACAPVVVTVKQCHQHNRGHLDVPHWLAWLPLPGWASRALFSTSSITIRNQSGDSLLQLVYLGRVETLPYQFIWYSFTMTSVPCTIMLKPVRSLFKVNKGQVESFLHQSVQRFNNIWSTFDILSCWLSHQFFRWFG